MTTSPSIGDCCLSGQIHHGIPEGWVDTIGGLPTYIAEPQDKSKSKSVIFITDLFGYKLPNIRLFADEFAKAGFYVYIPDLLFDDPLDPVFLQNAEPSLKEREKNGGLINKSIRGIKVATTAVPWLLRHRESVTRPILNSFMNTVRNIPGTNKVGIIGFCWGGKYAALVAHGSSSESVVDAVYICHPSGLDIPGDFQAVATPLSMAIGDKDSLVSAKDVAKIVGLLAEKPALPTEVRVYEDQVHGFALRSDWSSDKDKLAMDGAVKQGVEWFHRFL